MVHHQMTCFHKKVLVESCDEKVETLKILSRKETFAATVKAALSEFYEAKAVEDLGLDQPPRQKPSERWILDRIEALYGEVIELAENMKKDVEERERRENKKRRTMNGFSPHNLSFY